MSNLQKVKLSDLVSRVKVGFVGSINEYYCSPAVGVPLLRTTDISDLNFDRIKYVTKEFSNKNKKSLVKKGDLIVARHGDNGSAIVYEKDFFAQVLNAVVIEPNHEKMSPYLLKIFLESPFVRKQIKGSVKGSVQGVINTKHVADLLIPLFSDLDYNYIENLIVSIDKKIELNNRINAELEAMAKTLYDYWFVQFDFPDDSPQSQGKPYKTSGGKMVYNPTLKREIPEGWEVAPLSSITRVSNESINPADYPEKLFKHFSIPVFDATNTFGVERGDTIGSNKFTVEDTDLLVSKLNPWFNRVVYAMAEPEQICSTEFVVWRCPNASIKNFMYMIATSPQFIAHCTQSATGTSNSHKRVNPNVMMRFDQPFNLKVAEKLGQHLEPILKQLIVNQRENTKLASLRDWLLPMLMNGQVTVGEAN